MEASVELTSLALVALAALVCGMAMARFNQPPIFGYILAGVLLGPSVLGVVEDREQIELLAELGVLLLLFIIGTELSIRAFMVAWRMALMAVALQVGASLAVIFACSSLLGFSFQLSVLLGFVVALSSTAVAIKMLEEIGESRTRVGRVTVGILIAQDLAFLPMLLVVEHLGSVSVGETALAKIVLAVLLLVLLVRWLSRRRRIDLPVARAVVGNADLSPLTGLAYCFGAGAVFGLMGLSAAYGAFLTGLVIGNSAQREQLVQAVRPVQSVLVMAFFLSIGLLIDLGFIIDNIATVLTLLGVVTLFKTAMNVGILRLLGESWQRAFLQGVVLSQLGEFSFLLAAGGLATGAIGQADVRLVITVTALSLMLSPIWLITARRLHGLATGGVSSFRDVVNAAYGGEAAAVRHGSTRLARMVIAAAMWIGGVVPSRRPKASAAAPSPANDDATAESETGDTAETIAAIGAKVRAAAGIDEREASGDETDERPQEDAEATHP